MMKRSVESSSSEEENFIEQPSTSKQTAKKVKTKTQEMPEFICESFPNWAERLSSNPKLKAAPVALMKHASFSSSWDQWIKPGKVVEIGYYKSNKKMNLLVQEYWVATVLEVKGYLVKFRYVGEESASNDFYLNMAVSNDVHHTGWGMARKIAPTTPPNFATKFENYKAYEQHMRREVDVKPSLYRSFKQDRKQSLEISKFQIGDQMEVQKLSRRSLREIRLATVVDIIGKRIKVSYFDSEDVDWFHEESPLIHPLGFGSALGLEVTAPEDYSPPEYEFPEEFEKFNAEFMERFQPGMKFELVDPLFLSISLATIKKVLPNGYILVSSDQYLHNGKVSRRYRFCVHITSAWVLPCGFGARYGIKVIPNEENVTVQQYLEDNDLEAAPIPEPEIEEDPQKPKWEVNMRVEVADLFMSPHLIFPGKVAKIAGNLIRINFDGYVSEFDQWMDSKSPEIYPIGWAQLFTEAIRDENDKPVCQRLPPVPKVKFNRKRG